MKNFLPHCSVFVLLDLASAARLLAVVACMAFGSIGMVRLS